MTNPAPQHRSDDHFYVGYLPAPDPHRRFVLLLVALLTLWTISAAIILVLTQRSPGPAVWLSSNQQSWTGILVETPYPMLIPDKGDDAFPLLVVSMGKAGAHAALRDAFDHRVTLSGFALQREGRNMIELAPEPDAIKIFEPIEPDRRPAITQVNSRSLELVGEIIDGKCFLGAMKPGDGTAHRSCAALCMRGGLPPMFAAESDLGDILYPLLMVDGSCELKDETIQMVASRVRVRGVLTNIAGLPVLSVKHEDIHPIGLFDTYIP